MIDINTPIKGEENSKYSYMLMLWENFKIRR
jgi:hypothetical protein